MTETEERLVEWAKEKFYPGWEEPSPSAVLARVMEEGRDSRRKTNAGRLRRLRELERQRTREPIACKESRGVRMEIVVHEGESVACPPDGGAGKKIERMANAIERSARCRVVGELIDVMPGIYRLIVWHTYGNCAAPGEIPRDPREAYSAIGVSKVSYFRYKNQMLKWLGERLGLSREAAAA